MKVKKTRTPKFKPFKRAQNPSKSYDIYIYQLPKNYNIQLYIILII